MSLNDEERRTVVKLQLEKAHKSDVIGTAAIPFTARGMAAGFQR